ncbi:hypothetical protein ACFSWE_08535 [Leucobacter albus]|uniref:Uncharacterized protein n=1 Tax=Leucobacter albus TaxID=272210 RepID=A0ABW3TQ03_9MICO
MNWWDIPLAVAAVYAGGIFVIAAAGLLSYSTDLPDKVRLKTARMVVDAWKWPALIAQRVRVMWKQVLADARANEQDS